MCDWEGKVHIKLCSVFTYLWASLNFPKPQSMAISRFFFCMLFFLLQTRSSCSSCVPTDAGSTRHIYVEHLIFWLCWRRNAIAGNGCVCVYVAWIPTSHKRATPTPDEPPVLLSRPICQYRHTETPNSDWMSWTRILFFEIERAWLKLLTDRDSIIFHFLV